MPTQAAVISPESLSVSLPRRDAARSAGQALIAALPYGVLLAGAFSVFAQTVDDPFITFRYAANLVAGFGPVFNLGEHVEGFSSPLHLLLSALLTVLFPSVGLLFKAKLASLLFAGVVLVQTRALARRTGVLGDRGAALAQLLVALNINFALAAVNGLETTLYAALLLLFAGQFYTECRTGSGYRSAALAFLLLLARPDALVVIGACAVLRTGWAVAKRLPGQFAWGWLLVFLAPAACLLAARLWYYHSPLPNTYYAKHIGLRQALPLGLRYLRQPLSPEVQSLGRQSGGALNKLALTFTPVFYGLALLGLTRVYRTLSGLVCLTVIGAVLTFVLLSGGDWMPGWRFMVPALPFFAILQARGLFRGFRSRRRTVPAYAALGLWLVSSLIAPHYPWGSIGYSTRDSTLVSHGSWGSWQMRAGAFIKRTFPKGAVLAYSEMGYAGYVNLDKTFLDLRGLTNTQIARFPAREKDSTGVLDPDWMTPGDPLYGIIVARRPDAILTFDGPTPDAVHEASVVLGDYRHTGSFGQPGRQDPCIEVFRRRARPPFMRDVPTMTDTQKTQRSSRPGPRPASATGGAGS